MPLATDDFLDIDDVTPAELDALLDRAAAMKAGETDPRLGDATLGMIFEKPSTRTRVSFETGMTRLGGHAMFLGPDDIQLGHGEPLKDTARVLGRYVDGVMARLFDHADVEVLAEYADCPVINGLTDEAHPCQTLADLLTIRETVGEDAAVAWVGDGNNVGQSFVVGAAMAGVDVEVATPAGYGMDPDVFERAAEFGADVAPTTDPATAIEGADVVYTDVWISMGQEEDAAARREAFAAYTVTPAWFDDLSPRGVFMHDLPAHYGEETVEEAVHHPRSVVFDQAENRLHAHKAILATLLGDPA